MDFKDAFVHGTCLCGGVAFHAALPEQGANHCYCTMCQKFHGAAAGSYLTVGAGGYVVERGAGLITEYASSSQGRRGFCRVCGAAIFFPLMLRDYVFFRPS